MSSKPKRVFHGHRRRTREPKSRRNPAACLTLRSLDRRERLEPLATAAVAIPTPAVTAIAVTAIKSAVPPAAAEPAVPLRQNGEATPLAFVEGLVERIGHVRDTPHRRRGCRHGVGAFAQP